MEKYSSPVPTWIRFYFILFLLSLELHRLFPRAPRVQPNDRQTLLYLLHRHNRLGPLSSRSLYFSLLKQNRFPLIFFSFSRIPGVSEILFDLNLTKRKWGGVSVSSSDSRKLFKTILPSPGSSSSPRSGHLLRSVPLYVPFTCLHVLVSTLWSLESPSSTYDRLIYQFLNLFQLWF